MASYIGSIQKWLALDKWNNMMKIIRENGGIRKCFSKLYIQDAIKDGNLVGTDEFGNRYYENPRYFMPRDRWVEYADHVGINYDGSQVPAEWCGWLHHKTDCLPCEEEIRTRRCWSMPHTENWSGTTSCYMPYNTTRPTIIPWDGKPRPSLAVPPTCEKPKADPCTPKCQPVDCQS